MPVEARPATYEPRGSRGTSSSTSTSSTSGLWVPRHVSSPSGRQFLNCGIVVNFFFLPTPRFGMGVYALSLAAAPRAASHPSRDIGNSVGSQLLLCCSIPAVTNHVCACAGISRTWQRGIKKEKQGSALSNQNAAAPCGRTCRDAGGDRRPMCCNKKPSGISPDSELGTQAYSIHGNWRNPHLS